MSKKLYDLVHGMTGMVSRWLEPGHYINNDGNKIPYGGEDAALIADIIATLDGPDYREAMEDASKPDHEALITKWAHDRNLVHGSTPEKQFLKLIEEVGEAAGAQARGKIDGVKDGIGDAVVVLTILAAQNGLTLSECVAAAWGEIKDRKGRMVDGVFVKDGE